MYCFICWAGICECFKGGCSKSHICSVIVGSVLFRFSLFVFFALLNSKKITEHSPEFEWDPMTKYSLHCNWVPFKREK